MSDKDKAKDKDKDGKGDASGEAPKPSKLPVIVAVLNLFATGAVGGLVFVTAGASASEVEEIDTSEPPIVLTLEPFVVNLNEQTASRYLKATVEFEVYGEERQQVFENKKRAIRDDLLRYFSSLSVADTLGEAGKMAIRDEVARRVEAHMGADALEGVYLTEFVVQ